MVLANASWRAAQGRTTRSVVRDAVRVLACGSTGSDRWRRGTFSGMLSGMSSKTWIVPGVAVLGAVLACTQSTDPGGAGGNEPDAGVDSRFTFSPRDAARACTRDDECVILPALNNCSSCCGEGAVARGEAESAYASVVEACRGPGAPDGAMCAMYCGAFRAACYEGTCVKLADADAGDQAPAPECTPGSSTTDGGAPDADPGVGPSCGARVVKTGFEDGLDPSWVATDPSSFRIDHDEPIAGSASLRISYKQNDAHLTIEQPDACATRIAFTLRTRLLASGITLARIVAGDGSWFHVRLDGCALSVAEEIRSDSAAGLGASGQGWPVPDDSPVRVVITLDLRSKSLTTAVAPLGEPLPAPQSMGVRGDPSGAGAIRAIELGAAPGVMSPGVGAVWIDDLVID